MSTEGGRRLDRRQALRITALAGVGAGFGGSILAALLRRAALHRVSDTRPRMGTVVTVTVVHADPAAARRMIVDTFGEIDRLERVLSRHRPDSPLSRLNRTGALDGAPPELTEVVGRAGEYARITGGAFDPTVMPLLRLYEQWFSGGEAPPSDGAVRAALARVGYERVNVDRRSIRFAERGMAITLDGIAKGYVVDRAVDVLVAEGATRVLVDAGGDMATAGEDSREEPWTVAVQDPHDERRAVELVRLGGSCIATSGDYMRTFTGDHRYHHIIDPRTGYSPEHTSSATVLAPTAMDADALSTAVLVLGPGKGIELLEGLRGVEGVVVSKRGDRIRTSGMGRASA